MDDPRSDIWAVEVRYWVIDSSGETTNGPETRNKLARRKKELEWNKVDPADDFGARIADLSSPCPSLHAR